MSLFLDSQFVDKISHLFRNFRRKADLTWNFSCPICGDSKKNKTKARGYFIRSKAKDGSPLDGLTYKCHNCGVSMPFGDFLKAQDADAYSEYVMEKFKEAGESRPKPAPKQIKKKDYAPPKPIALIGCPSIATLGADHVARQYIEKRRIPVKFHTELYWTDNFPALVDRVCPGHSFSLKKEGRIIIPCLDRNNNLLAIQGRTLDPNATVRYLTVKTFEDAPKIYGMHRLGNAWKRIYIVEGPFDSLFLPNCLAMCGSDIPSSLPRENVVVVYDNEPTSETTREKIQKAINQNWRVCIWPETIHEKDLNEMILNGHSAESIRSTIDRHSYVGLEAQGEFEMWSKRPRPKTKKKGNEQ